MKKLISIIIVTYNSQNFIASCLDHIQKQKYKSYEVIVVDNASCDKTIQILKKYSWIQLITNTINVGFSKANNQGIQQVSGEFVLLLNPDTFLTSSSLKNLISCVQSDSSLGFVSPKLLKPDNKKIIDSTGIQATPERRFFDRGRGEIDVHQYDQKTNIFAGCGAALLLRKKALDDIKIGSEYLDEDFFAYFEDVDLCWRMRLRGWQGVYCPKAIIYHKRGQDLQIYGKENFFVFLSKRYLQAKDKNTRKIRSFVLLNSVFVLIKNDSLFELSRYSFSFFCYWSRRLLYILLVEPYSFFALPLSFSKFLLMFKKRKIIRQRLLIKDKDLRIFFSYKP